MRSREEIVKDFERRSPSGWVIPDYNQRRLILEVLLDIRDLLNDISRKLAREVPR
jgi:hypothetical protein